MLGVFIRKTFWLEKFLPTSSSIKMEQNVPKRRNIKFRRRGITQKQEYDIQNAVKV
jgi:hypothetical protein